MHPIWPAGDIPEGRADLHQRRDLCSMAGAVHVQSADHRCRRAHRFFGWPGATHPSHCHDLEQHAGLVHFSTVRASRGARRIITSPTTDEVACNGFGPLEIGTVEEHWRKQACCGTSPGAILASHDSLEGRSDESNRAGPA
ncbi:hypothetical protein J2W25_001677 [Variovorax boronicumulans]|uniref:Uncharacterized protein n=1 Tax=Variovorax boronicumulans TaxID=436515 RepID=A0AAW8DT91_9BURK|nr:hypothetical protein [Variovorax boronicumulans]MDP9877371.1 hypothetical protein [Variovorax boronicumulans]MDP9922656.1 hypothetical protein [Variovorax boronicumulans]